MAITSIFSFANQKSLYAYNVERSFTILSGTIQARAIKDQDAFNATQASERSALEERSAALRESKNTIADQLDRVRRARENIIAVKSALADAAAAAKAGNRGAFDTALLTVNLRAGNSRTDPDNLVGFMGATNVGGRTEVVSVPNGDVDVQTRSISSTYAIQLDDGTQVTPDMNSNSIRLNGKKYDLPAVSFVSRTGEEVTFQVDNNGTPETYTGTLQRGGLGITSSFTYGGLPADASPESEAFRQQAVDDVRAAIKLVNNLDRSLAMAELDVARGFGKVEVEADATKAEYDATIDRQGEELKAFSRALQTRTQIALSSIALSSKTAETMLTSMFAEEPEPTQTVLDQLGMNYRRKKD